MKWSSIKDRLPEHTNNVFIVQKDNTIMTNFTGEDMRLW